MSIQVSGPGGQTYTVNDDNQVFDANNNAIGHVDAASGSFVDQSGAATALTDLASQGFITPDSFGLTPQVPAAGDNLGATRGGLALPGGDGEPVGEAAITAGATIADRMQDVVAFIDTSHRRRARHQPAARGLRRGARQRPPRRQQPPGQRRLG